MIFAADLQGETLTFPCHREGVMVTGECEPPRGIEAERKNERADKQWFSTMLDR